MEGFCRASHIWSKVLLYLCLKNQVCIQVRHTCEPVQSPGYRADDISFLVWMWKVSEPPVQTVTAPDASLV